MHARIGLISIRHQLSSGVADLNFLLSAHMLLLSWSICWQRTPGSGWNRHETCMGSIDSVDTSLRLSQTCRCACVCELWCGVDVLKTWTRVDKYIDLSIQGCAPPWWRVCICMDVCAHTYMYVHICTSWMSVYLCTCVWLLAWLHVRVLAHVGWCVCNCGPGYVKCSNTSNYDCVSVCIVCFHVRVFMFGGKCVCLCTNVHAEKIYIFIEHVPETFKRSPPLFLCLNDVSACHTFFFHWLAMLLLICSLSAPAFCCHFLSIFSIACASIIQCRL